MNLPIEPTTEELRLAITRLNEQRAVYRVRVLSERQPQWDIEQLTIIEEKLALLVPMLAGLDSNTPEQAPQSEAHKLHVENFRKL